MKLMRFLLLLIFPVVSCSSYTDMLEEYNGKFTVETGTKSRPLIGDVTFEPSQMIPKDFYTCASGDVFSLEAPGSSVYSNLIYQWTLYSLENEVVFSAKGRFLSLEISSSYDTGKEYKLQLVVSMENTSGASSTITAGWEDSTSLVFYSKRENN